MKKSTFILALAVIFGMVSCSKNELNPETSDTPGTPDIPDTPVAAFTVKAAGLEQTRVSYSGGAGTAIQPTWEVDDTVVGWDDLGQKFTFTVSSVSSDGVATFSLGSYAPGDATKLYAVYYPGTATSDIVNGEIAVDLTAQDGALETDSPFLMCATASIESNSATLKFENKAAIFGMTSFKINAGETITSFSIEGINTTGKFAVVGDKLDLVTDSSIAAITASGLNLQADSQGIVYSNLYFAVLPTEGATILAKAFSSDAAFQNATPITTTDILAGGYYYTSKVFEEIGGSDAIIKVGTEKFQEISDAVAAINSATSAVNVEILNDFDLSQIFSITNTNPVTVDLAGKTISITDAASYISIANGAAVTITDTKGSDGTIELTDIALEKNTYAVHVNGSLTLSGGNLKSSSSSFYSGACNVGTNGSFTMTGGRISGAKCLYNNGIATINGGTIVSEYSGTETTPSAGYCICSAGKSTVNGATLTATYSGSTTNAGIAALWTTGANAQLEVSNSTITGDKYGSYATTSASVTFKDGTVLSGKNAVYSALSSTTNIKGGTFSNNGNVTCQISNAALNISGGTITHKDGGDAAVYGTDGATIYVTGGEISSSKKYGIYAHSAANLTVSGGHISSSVSHGIYTNCASGKEYPQVHISGGLIEASGTGSTTTSCGVYTYCSQNSSISDNVIIKSANCIGAYFFTNSTITVNGGYFSGSTAIYKGTKTTIYGGYFSTKNTSWPTSPATGESGEWDNGTGDGIKYIYRVVNNN